jgi:DNA-directed RNA polymerase alpha subunit
MNPKIDNISDKGSTLQFTLSGVNVSLANALRRTILSDIDIVVFKTSPYEENKAIIYTNTTRLNNEILKQRLSCIPIHIQDLNIPLNNYLLELKEENNTDTMMIVTTENFKIKNLQTNSYLSQDDVRKIFPASDITGYFIDFVKLRPKISDELPGEKIHLTCEFSISNAKDDGMFNCVSTCAYGFTPDDVKIKEELNKKQQNWKDMGMNAEEIAFESKNWQLLDALRIVKKDSFDFTIETIGIYSNQEIIQKACDIIIKKLENINNQIDVDELEIRVSDTTMNNCFDIRLKNEDYTIGKIIEYFVYSNYFEGLKTLNYCGFKKFHPHDIDSIIRVAYIDPVDISTIKQNIKECVTNGISVFEKIKKIM